MIYLQHEVRGGYPGCSKCKKVDYPYYLGSDKKYYCEACAEALAKEGLGKFGRISDIQYCPTCKGTGRI